MNGNVWFVRMLRKNKKLQALALLSPALFWLVIFFGAPLLIVLIVSFGKRGPFGAVIYTWTLDNYIRFLDPIYGRIFLRSIWIALVNTVLCLLVGYPLAYFIARQPRGRRNALLLLVMIPFWTNFLVRTYAWMILLRDTGLINSLLLAWGVISSPCLCCTTSRR